MNRAQRDRYLLSLAMMALALASVIVPNQAEALTMTGCAINLAWLWEL